MLEGVPVRSPYKRHSGPHGTFPFTCRPTRLDPQYRRPSLPLFICICNLAPHDPTASLPLPAFTSLHPAFAPERLCTAWRPLYFISCMPAPLQHSSRLSRPFRCPKRVRPRRRLHAPSVYQYRGRQVRLSVWHVQPNIQSVHIRGQHGHRPASVASD